MRGRPTILALAGVSLALVPAVAQADPTVTVTDPCPRVGFANAAVAVAAAGFQAGEPVDFYYGSLSSSPVTESAADATGSITGALTPAPELPAGHNESTLTVFAKGTMSGATAQSPAVPIVTPKVVLPERGHPNSKVLYKVYGFPSGKTVYAHYILHKHVKKVEKLGKANSPCGLLKKRLALLPAKFHTGTWTYHFNNSKSKPSLQPYFEIKYLFTRASKASSASLASRLGLAFGF